MSKTLDIRIDVPKDVSDKAARFAEAKAREAAVIALQQEGELTIREAAEELGLSYEGYLNLLASRELPISKEASDQTAIDELRQAVLGQGHEEG